MTTKTASRAKKIWLSLGISTTVAISGICATAKWIEKDVCRPYVRELVQVELKPYREDMLTSRYMLEGIVPDSVRIKAIAKAKDTTWKIR